MCFKHFVQQIRNLVVFETFCTTNTIFGSVWNFFDDKTRNMVLSLKPFARELRYLEMCSKLFGREIRNLVLCLKLFVRELRNLLVFETFWTRITKFGSV